MNNELALPVDFARTRARIFRRSTYRPEFGWHVSFSDGTVAYLGTWNKCAEVLSSRVTPLKRMRLLCRLRHIDVWAGTGIPVARISKAERGLLTLNRPEAALLSGFLCDMWQVQQEHEKRLVPYEQNSALSGYVQ